MKDQWCCGHWDVNDRGGRSSGFCGCGRRWPRDRLDSIGWGLFFMWAALVLLAKLVNFAGTSWDGWAVFFTGAGLILLGATIIRNLVPEYRRPGLIWGWIFGFVLLSIGLGDAMAWIWALVLAVIGFSILKGLSRR